MKKFNTFKLNEGFEHNLKIVKEKGYTPKYKPGYFIVRFMDDNSPENKFGLEYINNNKFLKKFADTIGAEIVPKNEQPNDMSDYLAFRTEPDNEIECMKIAESYDFVLDTDLYDQKYYEILGLFEDINEELEDYYEFNMISDGDLNKKLNYIEGIIKEIRKNI